jgi:cytochrome b6-f complex iron-sulfur subunit
MNASDSCSSNGSCQPTPDNCCTRRQFMRTAVGLVGLVWGGVAAYPLLKYLQSGSSDDSAQQVSSVTIGKVDDFAKASGKNFKFGSKPGILYRDAEGNFSAYSAICTHLGCTVQYNPEGANILCACHGGIYDAKTGGNISGPPPKPLVPLKVTIVNNNVVISKA